MTFQNCKALPCTKNAFAGLSSPDAMGEHTNGGNELMVSSVLPIQGYTDIKNVRASA
jgi:hypothetical protein